MGTRLPLISVITTVYNTEKYVERCFDSVLNQSYKNIEFIVVDNGSSGDITEIVLQYQTAYPNHTIKLVSLKENVGLFHARLIGSKNASGDYIAFIDSDDRVSLDFYRALLKKAITTGSDMVATDFVYEDESGRLSRDIYNPIPTFSFEWTQPQIMSFYLEEAATSFYWNLIWNKLYSIDLWKRCVPYFEKNTEKIVMCDDIAFTVVLYSEAKKYTNIHNVKYYYLRRSDANSVGGDSVERTSSIINDIGKVFSFFENYVNQRRLDKHGDVCIWKKRYLRIWTHGINYSSLRTIEKKLLCSSLQKLLNVQLDEKDACEDWIFSGKQAQYNDGLEQLREHIADNRVKYVSFDIFDTLLKRSLWEPFDLFELLNFEYKRLSGSAAFVEFSKMRAYGERKAREHYVGSGRQWQDITFNEIYEEIGNIYHIDKQILEKMKQKEIELETQVISARETGKELFEFAVALGKPVVLITDMYLPQCTIIHLLQRCGYNLENVKIFVSSEVRRIKSTGDLFRYALRELQINDNSCVLHIGDNFEVDVQGARKIGMQSAYLPKIQTVFCNGIADVNAGNLFYNWYLKRNEATYTNSIFSNLISRRLMALVINEFFDNPFVSYIEETEFNADPYYIGYFCIGFLMLQTILWIDYLSKKNGYQKVHFMSRDGYLIKKCYDAFYPEAKSNYLYASRDALTTLFFEKGPDLLGFSFLTYSLNYSPRKLLDLFCDVLKISVSDAIVQCSKNDFIVDQKFKSKEDCDQFLVFLSENLLDYSKLEEYRSRMKRAFAKVIGPHECTVDIGYSGRPESILSRLLGYPIDALYLFSNGDKASINSRFSDVKIQTLFPYFIQITNEILLELFISDTGASCKTYKIDAEDNMQPIFKDVTQNFSTRFFINIMHDGALKFIHDVKHYLPDIQYNYMYSPYDLLYPVEYLLKRAPSNDFGFLEAAYFDDEIDNPEVPNLRHLRESDLMLNCQSNHTLEPFAFTKTEKLKKAVYLLMYDRKALKDKIKNKYASHPLALQILRVCYSIPRRIYHCFRKKW